MAVAALSLAREGHQGHLGRGRQHCELGAGGGEGGAAGEDGGAGRAETEGVTRAEHQEGLGG